MNSNNNNLSEVFQEYRPSDCGKWGKAGERSLKRRYGMKDKVSKPGQVDFRRARVCYEVKTGGGEVKSLLNSKLKYVLYIPVVREELSEAEQEGFLVDREVFLEMLEGLGLLRHKVTTRGTDTVSIQTFWNHSKNKPHGRVYFDLLDALYDNCIMTLEEFMAQDCKL